MHVVRRGRWGLPRFKGQARTAAGLPHQDRGRQHPHATTQSKYRAEAAPADEGGCVAFSREHEGWTQCSDPGAVNPVFATGIAECAPPMSLKRSMSVIRADETLCLRWFGRERPLRICVDDLRGEVLASTHLSGYPWGRETNRVVSIDSLRRNEDSLLFHPLALKGPGSEL